MKIFVQFISIFSLLVVVSLSVSQPTRSIQTTNESIPVPKPWPEQFHALLSMSLSDGLLQISNLWYDWPKGLNVNLMQKELGELLYDVEWNNGTSFYYTLGANGACEVMNFEVGILRPDFLDGATYLGIREINSFKCNVWEKADFIWYYEDVVTKVPVGWDFYDGITTRVITYEIGAMLEVSQVQAPAYCFSQNEDLQVNKLQTSASKERESYQNLRRGKYI